MLSPRLRSGCRFARIAGPLSLARAHAGRQFVQYGGASRETIDLIADGKSVGRGWLPRHD